MKLLALAAVAVLSLALTGCSGTLSEAEAGERYLAAVCPANEVGDEMSAAIESEDIAAVNEIGIRGIAAARAAADQLDAEVGWPESVAYEVEVMQDYYYGDIGEYEQLSTVTTMEDAYPIGFDPDSIRGETAQRIRAVLDLPAGTACK